MLRHIAWFCGAPIRPDANGILVSDDDVVCRRVLTPAHDIEAHDINCSVFGNLEEAEATDVTNHLQKLGVDIVVLGAMSADSVIRLARAAKHLGCYVIVDFGAESDGLHDLHDAPGLFDLCVAATPERAEAIIKQTGITSAVVPDIAADENQKDARKAIAKLWVECFKYVKQKPPVCANTNLPGSA